MRQGLAPILPILSEEIWQAETWIEKQDIPEYAELEFLDEETGVTDENTVEKYFDDVETVLSCRWIDPPTWWKGDEELDQLHNLVWKIVQQCRNSYGKPTKRGNAINYGVGGEYDILLCPDSKFASRFVNTIIDSNALSEFTSCASTEIIASEEMDKLQYAVIAMPGNLRVSDKCNIRVHLRRTENTGCKRCGGYYIKPKVDEFDIDSSVCNECTLVESEQMDYY